MAAARAGNIQTANRREVSRQDGELGEWVRPGQVFTAFRLSPVVARKRHMDNAGTQIPIRFGWAIRMRCHALSLSFDASAFALRSILEAQSCCNVPLSLA